MELLFFFYKNVFYCIKLMKFDLILENFFLLVKQMTSLKVVLPSSGKIFMACHLDHNFRRLAAISLGTDSIWSMWTVWFAHEWIS